MITFKELQNQEKSSLTPRRYLLSSRLLLSASELHRVMLRHNIVLKLAGYTAGQELAFSSRTMP